MLRPAFQALTPAQQAIALAMPEDKGGDSLDAHVRKYLADLDLQRKYHTLRSKGSQPGFLDWVICGTRVLWRELKREDENPTADQQAWIDDLRAAGQDADVWRPSDYLSGHIARELIAVSRFAGRLSVAQLRAGGAA
jgi:hypothetical protein